ncbi:MAG TPA: PD-(D/E)XK nuclease family protein [Gammaproteobacteria bacterium]|nr:PD-(D/E)XK nuclease family protein [Gammaproteobacteria bacterium]
MATNRIWHEARVLAALEAGACVITSGERLARAVRLAHAAARAASGAQVWERPEVLTYSGFINRLYETAMAASLQAGIAPPPKRLSEPAAEVAWEEVIRSTTHDGGLLQPAAAAQEAQRAWNLCSAYRIPLERIAAAGDEDARQFALWAEHFRCRSRTEGWLEDARLMDWLATRVRDRSIPAPAATLIAGFDEFAPQQAEFLESLRVAGSRVEVLKPSVQVENTVRGVDCADAEEEGRAAARWARALLDREPAVRIGIVVEDLDGCRDALARALDDALCPGASAGDPAARPYELSLGQPLAAVPAVHAACTALELLRGRVSFATASLLLRTPFIVAAEGECAARARLELQLRARQSGELSLEALVHHAAHQAGVARLHAALGALIAVRLPARQAPSAWAALFRDVLTGLGWPGERGLDSAEYQAVTAFHELNEGLVRLDAVLGAIAFGEALTRLKRLAGGSLFQPAGEDAPVQVMGLLETSGLRFDHLWVMGLSDETWPASPRPAPFIPPRLQREHGVPHSSAALELAFAQRVTERLQASAGQVLVSTPAQEGDAKRRPSPLLAALEQVRLQELPQAGLLSYRRRLQAEHAAALESYIDERGPALAAAEGVWGGTQLIRSQGACPFQAFGRFRLGAEPLQEPGLGPDAGERGHLAHLALEALWSQLEDQAALLALDVAARRTLAERCASQAVAERTRKLPEVYTRRVAELERGRLTELLGTWLEQDAARPPFKVMEREAKHRLGLGPLDLTTRVDRIDELPDGGRVIVDYKTGRVNLKGWLDARPDDPQLPLYAVGNPTRLAGLAYASLLPGEMRYLGLAEREGVADGVMAYAGYRFKPEAAADWPALLGFWRRTLAALAEDYAAGDARVAPKSADTCRHCHLAMLCRIHELARPVEESGDDD